MRISPLPWLATLALYSRYFSAAASETPSSDCSAVDTAAGSGAGTTCSVNHRERSAQDRNPDSVSLLQSRGIKIEYADEAAAVGTIAPQPEPRIPSQQHTDFRAAGGLALLTQHSLTGMNPLLSIVLIIASLLVFCWVFCFVVGTMKEQREKLYLETRVASVLQHQRVGESLTQPLGHMPAGKPGASPVLPHRSLVVSSFSRLFGSRSAGGTPQAAPAPDSVPSSELPPPLARAGAPLSREAQLVANKTAMLAAHPSAKKGGDILFLTPDGAPLMRANVRNVDGDFWLEVAMHGEKIPPSAMVRLTHRDGNPLAYSTTTTTPPAGAELFGPEGDFYGTFERSNAGTTLVYSTTALPVLSLEGDVRSSQLMARTVSGFELAKMSASAGTQEEINIFVQKGADLALTMSSLLAVVFSA